MKTDPLFNRCLKCGREGHCSAACPEKDGYLLARITCRLFGHKPLTTAGWSRGAGYASVQYEDVDNLGTKHLCLSAKCPRCGHWYDICNVSVPAEGVA